MQQKGIIYSIGNVRDVSDKFKVRSFILKETWKTRFGEQENFIPMQVIQGNCGLLDSLEVRDEVIVQFNIDGRLFIDENTKEEKCFVNLTAYQIDLTVPRENADSGEDKAPTTVPTQAPPSGQPSTTTGPKSQEAPFPTQSPPEGDDGPDDLPF